LNDVLSKEKPTATDTKPADDTNLKTSHLQFDHENKNNPIVDTNTKPEIEHRNTVEILPRPGVVPEQKIEPVVKSIPVPNNSMEAPLIHQIFQTEVKHPAEMQPTLVKDTLNSPINMEHPNNNPKAAEQPSIKSKMGLKCKTNLKSKKMPKKKDLQQAMQISGKPHLKIQINKTETIGLPKNKTTALHSFPEFQNTNETKINKKLANKQDGLKTVECTKCDFSAWGKIQMIQHFKGYHKDRIIQDRSQAKVILIITRLLKSSYKVVRFA
jgi:hypothetical protein